MTNLDQIILEAIKLVLAGIIGGLIGARANDKLTRRRERDSGVTNRKRDFLAFMAQLEAEAVNNYSVDFGNFYQNKIPNLRHSAALIIGDFPPNYRTEFEGLIAAACDLTEKDIYNPGNKNEIIARVKKITQFAKNLPN